MYLTRREIVGRAVQGFGAMAASTAFLPEIAEAASKARSYPELGQADLDLLVAVTTAVAAANGIQADTRARERWRQAFAVAYSRHDTPTRATVGAVCARLRREAPRDSLHARADPSVTRQALRAGLASRAPAERALDARIAAAVEASREPTDLGAWLKQAQTGIARRRDELRRQIGDDPTARDEQTGELKHQAHLSVPGQLPDLAGINDPSHPAVVRRLVTGSAVSLAGAVLFDIPTQPAI